MPLSSVLGLAGLSVAIAACRRRRIVDAPRIVRPEDAIVPQMIVRLVASDPTLRPEDLAEIFGEWFRLGHTSWPPS